MIHSFKDPAVEDLFHGRKSQRGLKFPNQIVRVALRKLDMLNTASELKDLRVPPANRLEALEGRLKDFYSIRVNDQWRFIFKWENKGPSEVSLIDYH